jgi:pimeloyl-ACP methyl ester carboxylesterase
MKLMRFLSCLLLLSLFGPLPSRAQTTAAPLPEGWQALPMAGYRLAYKCLGSGSPTLILEPPSGISVETAYKNVLPQLAAKHKTCFYERVGFGPSDAAPPGLWQTASDYRAEADKMIELAAPNDPLLLVGYSFGGLVARQLAQRHAERVVGLMLIDALQEDWLPDLKARMTASDWGRMQYIMGWLLRKYGHDVWHSLPEMAEVRLPPGLPIRILSRGQPAQNIRESGMSEAGVTIFNQSHDRHQFLHLGHSNRTTRVVAQRSQHLILDYEPELFLAQLDLLLAEALDKP